jgi:ABC-type lipopolysaccharide export system ATPase subunit
LLQAVDLSFSYGRRNVLDGVGLLIGSGAIVGVLGPNG